METCDKNKIFREAGLNKQNLEDIKSLLRVCEEYDKPNQCIDESPLLHKEERNTYILYKEESLIGYLGIYPSFEEGQARATGVVHPSFRRRGIFASLFEEAKTICREKNIKRLHLINDQTSESGKEFVISTGAKYQYSSYSMMFDINNWENQKYELENFTLRGTCEEDLNDIVKIGMDGFDTAEEEERKYNKEGMENPQKNMYVGLYNNQAVGAISVVFENNEAYICDLAVLKKFRGRGIGKKILIDCIHRILNQEIKNIKLSVKAKNKNALSLYKYCGFGIETAYDSYELNIE